MIKTYFSKNEKLCLATLYGILDYLDIIIKQFEERGNKVKWLKMSKSFLDKATTTFVDSASDDALITLNKFVKGMYVTTVDKLEVQRLKKQKLESDEYVSIENDRFLYLCSFAYSACKECAKVNHTNCELKKVFLEYDIEPLKHVVDETKCPYNHNDLKENAYMNVEECVATGQLFRVQPGFVLKGFKRIHSAPLPKSYWHLPKISLK